MRLNSPTKMLSILVPLMSSFTIFFLYGINKASNLLLLAPRLYKESPLVKNCNSSTSFDSCMSSSIISVQNNNFIVIGDSHSYHLNGLFHALNKDYDLRSIIYTSTGQPYPDLMYFSKYRSLSTWMAENESMQSVISFIDDKLNSNTIFVISSRLEFFFVNQKFNLEHQNLKILLLDDQNNSINEAKALQIWIQKVNKLAEYLKSKDIPLIIFSPIPVFKGISSGNSYSLCSPAIFRPSLPIFCNEKISRNQLTHRFNGIRVALSNISMTNKNVFVFDPFPFLCPPENAFCERNTQGIQYMDDDDHLSFVGGSFLANSFIDFLKEHQLLE